MLEQPTDNFFLTDEHATAAIFTDIKGRVTEAAVIFNNDFIGIDAGGTVIVESADPVIYYETSKILSMTHGSTFELNGLTFIVRGIEHDGTGVTLVRLEKQ